MTVNIEPEGSHPHEGPTYQRKKEGTELSKLDSLFPNKIRYFSSEQNHKIDKTRGVVQIEQFN